VAAGARAARTFSSGSRTDKAPFWRSNQEPFDAEKANRVGRLLVIGGLFDSWRCIVARLPR
jgi:hypothetical protein